MRFRSAPWLIVLPMVIVVAGCTSTPAPSPTPTASASASASPEPTNASIDVSSVPVPAVADLEIPAGLADDELARAVVAAFDRWGMAGATPEAVEVAVDNDVALDPATSEPDAVDLADLSLLIAEAQTAAHAEALYGPDWAALLTADDIAMMKHGNVNILLPYVQTALTSSVPYEQGFEVLGVELVNETADGASTFVVRVQAYNNGSDSGFGADFAYPEQTLTFTTIESDGRTILTDAIAISTPTP